VGAAVCGMQWHKIGVLAVSSALPRVSGGRGRPCVPHVASMGLHMCVRAASPIRGGTCGMRTPPGVYGVCRVFLLLVSSKLPHHVGVGGSGGSVPVGIPGVPLVGAAAAGVAEHNGANVAERQLSPGAGRELASHVVLPASSCALGSCDSGMLA
jgi:hypothetical protein